MRLASILASVISIGAMACGDNAQTRVSYDAVAVVAPPSGTTAQGWQLTFRRATLAFGPVYFCAGASGSETLCGAAVGELRASVSLDLADSSPHVLGRVDGLTGHVGSASYDYGVDWFPTQPSPVPSPVAPDGHSAVFEGEARHGSNVLPFVVTVDLVPQYQGQRVIASAAAVGTVTSQTTHVAIAFDPGAWFAHVDFDRAYASAARPFVISPGTADHDAIVFSMEAESPPTFAWGTVGGER